MESPGLRHRVVTPPAAPLLDSDEQAAIVADFRSQANTSHRLFRVVFVAVSAVLFTVLCYAAVVESPFASLATASDAAASFHGAVGGSTPAATRRLVDLTQAGFVALATVRAATFDPLRAYRAGELTQPIRHFLLCLLSGGLSLCSLLYAWVVAGQAASALPPELRATQHSGLSAWEALYHLWPLAYHAVAAYAHVQMLEVEDKMATLVGSQYRHKTV